MNEGGPSNPDNKKEQFDINAFFDLSRTVPTEYRKLIVEQDKVKPMTTSFSEMWKSLYIPAYEDEEVKVLKEFLHARLSGDTVFDLGAHTSQDMVKICEASGVKTYIGVDNGYNDQRYPLGVAGMSYEMEKEGEFQTVYVKADMLHLLSLMRDNAASFIVNGIDHHIVPNKRYSEALVTELTRVTRKGGLIIGSNSDIDGRFDTKDDEAPFEKPTIKHSFVPYSFIYEKK